MYVKLHIRGTRTLMVHNPTLVDGSLPISKRYKEFTSKRGKTDEDHAEISKIEFEAGLYMDPKHGPCLPAKNFKSALQHAGKRTKNGSKVKEAVTVMESVLPLIYEGPRTSKGLWEARKKTADGEIRPYIHLEQLKVQGKRVMRTRPIFKEWGLKAHLYCDENRLDFSVLRSITETSGFNCGIGECRPECGRFEIVEFELVSDAEGLAAMSL